LDAKLPDPDVLIARARDAHQQFLLWQISYAELVITRRSGRTSANRILHGAWKNMPAGIAGSVQSEFFHLRFTIYDLRFAIVTSTRANRER